jgi:hypothetical protein
VAECRLKQGNELIEFVDRGIDIALLRVEQGNAFPASRNGDFALNTSAIANIIEIDHFADFS